MKPRKKSPSAGAPKPRTKSSSTLEDLFHGELRKQPVRGITFQRQLRFHPTRKFRFDFAVPEIKLAIEIDGFGRFGAGGHQTPWGMSADHEKANLAVEMGWTLLRYNRRLLGSIAKRKAAVLQVIRIAIRLLERG